MNDFCSEFNKIYICRGEYSSFFIQERKQYDNQLDINIEKVLLKRK